MPIRIEQSDAVAHVVLDAPRRLNPLSSATLAALQAALDELAARADVRVIVLRAEGRAFSAGHDLAEISAARAGADKGRARLEALFDQCAGLMQTILRQPQPVIASVQGLAAAAGCQLVASCDLAVAGETARFGVNGVNIGLFCSTPMVALSRNIGRKRAFELLTTGDFMTADEARQAGLVNRVVADDRLAQETGRLAAQIAGKLGVAVRIGKRAFYDQLEMPLSEAYDFTGRAIVANMMEDDTAEGIAAFLEKRDPKWEL